MVPSTDIGRGEHVPNVKVLQHAFKTPTLRNIDRRAPYMHDGSVDSLEETVAFYDDKFVKRPSLSPDIVKLDLTAEERAQIVAFMKTLTSEDKPIAVPSLPR
jgi:cytochrome c peroxidase